MKTFKIPVTWEVYGTIEVEAASLDEAIKQFDERESSENDFALPESNYVDGSFRREDEEICTLTNM